MYSGPFLVSLLVVIGIHLHARDCEDISRVSVGCRLPKASVTGESLLLSRKYVDLQHRERLCGEHRDIDAILLMFGFELTSNVCIGEEYTMK